MSKNEKEEADELFEYDVELKDEIDPCVAQSPAIHNVMKKRKISVKQAPVVGVNVQNVTLQDDQGEKVKVKKGALVCEYNESDTKYHTKGIRASKNEIESNGK